MMQRLHGAIAASVTPMRDGGRTVDHGAIAGLTRFLADGGVDGVLACGTTGEGVLLDLAERRGVALDPDRAGRAASSGRAEELAARIRRHPARH